MSLKRNVFLIFALLFLVVIISLWNVSGLASYTSYQSRPSFQAIYGPEGRLETYWPILGDKETCQARQDLLLQVSPVGCQPAVVRSDLLAEQNVPVFCQIDALQINPLIDIDKIRSISFSGRYPKDVAGAGFHPARAALRSRDKLLGSPLINNIGYVVVVLKRNPVEKELPDFVNVSLTARIDYEAGNAFGVGSAQYLLEPMGDEEWEGNKFRNSFWEGRYFVRLEKADPNSAIVSLYSGKRKIATTRVNKGETSRTVWVPGAYCRAGVKVAYDGFQAARASAVLAINDKGTDILDVYEGSRFLNDKCSVNRINIFENNGTGSVVVACSDNQRLELRLGNNIDLNYKKYDKFYLAEEYKKDIMIGVFLDLDKKQASGLTLFNGKVFVPYLEGKEVGVVDNNIIKLNKEDFNGVMNSDDGKFISGFIKGSYDVLNGAKIEGKEIRLNSIKAESSKAGLNLNNFNDAIESLERVADEYPAEKERDVEGSQRWGELALRRAIELAGTAGDNGKRTELIRKFIEIYSDSEFSEGYRYELSRMDDLDFSKAVGTVNIDNRYYNIRLIGLKVPKVHSNADFVVSEIKTGTVNVRLENLTALSDNGVGSVDSIRLDRIIDENSVSATVNCRTEKTRDGGYNIKSGGHTFKIGDEAIKVCEKSYMRVRDIEIKEIAKVRLLPEAQGTRTETNLTVNIGVEKRAIKLSTEKTEELIENLNKSIKKWENINEKLGNIVTGMKGACFATAGVLTVKNFLTGISGEALARQKVMQGWTVECNNLVNSGKYPTLSACYYGKSNEINNDVKEAQKAINDINSRIENIEKNYPIEGGGIFGGKDVDRAKAAATYCNDLKTRYGSRKVKTSSGEKSLSEVLGDCDAGYNKQGLYGYDELREIEYNLIMQDSTSSRNIKDNSGKLLQSGYDQILKNRNGYEEFEKEKQAKDLGLPLSTQITGSQRKNIVSEVVDANRISEKIKISGKSGSNTHFSSVNAYESKGISVNNVKKNGFNGGTYLLGLVKSEEGYIVQDVYVKNGENNYEKLPEDREGEFSEIYGIGRITSAESVSYTNPYKNPEVRYYETEPYKGMPAVVPFDVREGWYAATRQTLPAFGGIGAFDASGRVTSFYLCNVGPNGQEQFFEGYGDDICQLINLNTGQPLGFFPGLSESDAKRRVGQAVQAIEEAARKYGKKIVSINGKDFAVGNPAANLPLTQCQNFMSPEECHLLFNVCDPVICPSSRCDFGGKYPVADVVQTGIIGSTLLCLPNVREGIVVPVCLTGIHAGIEGFVSILRNHRDCLQESLATGRTVGICDQIYSVYLCEFFWRQIAPVAKIILPKIVEIAYGQGTRGGGEYLTVMAAWQNMQNSIDYFTQSYAVNSIKAFRARSIEEAGAPFCKAFVSAKAPTSFKTLIEPDSPPQFHAWFSSTKFTDVTIPATSQYKVFYHIFAGKDQGIHYNVYLRNPPESGYYSIPYSVQVASGFVGRGQYATESRDFTAPEGYRELCVRVNDQEECGFKEVSTSFAVNYLRDSYASDELKENDIKSESECISGSVNLKASILSPNIQANAEEALLPQVYQRGIVRICSSENPGSKTDPLRFVNVGYCGDQKIKCWLDKESVKKAITDNNKGLENATLSEIEKRQRNDLVSKGIIVGDDVAIAEIKEIKEIIDGIRTITVRIDDAKVSGTLVRLDALFNKTVLNHHKAQILYMIGDVKAIVVEKEIGLKNVEENRVSSVAQKAKEAVDGGALPSSKGEGGKNLEFTSFTLERDYKSEDKDRNYLFDSNRKTDIYILSDKIYFDVSSSSGLVGGVVNNHLDLNYGEFLSAFEDKYDNYGIVIGKTYFDILNGGLIQNNKIFNEVKSAGGTTARKSEGGKNSDNEEVKYYLSDEYNPDNTLYIDEKRGISSSIVLKIDKGKVYTINPKVFIGNIVKSVGEDYKINLKETKSIGSFILYVKSRDNSISDEGIKYYYKFKDAIITGRDVRLESSEASTGQTYDIR